MSSLHSALFFLFALSYFSCTSAQADVWRYVDQNGGLHFSSSQPAEQAKKVLESGNPLPSYDKAVDFTICDGLCDRRSVNWWVNSTKYKALEADLMRAAVGRGVEQALLEAVAAVESAFDPAVVSSKGAVGVMQVMPNTARMYGVEGLTAQDVAQKLKTPSINIDIAARHLFYLNKKYRGRLDLVLAAYNAGEGAVTNSSNNVPNYGETRRYVSNVLYLYALSKNKIR